MSISTVEFCKELNDYDHGYEKMSEERPVLAEVGDLFVISYDLLRESIYDPSMRDLGFHSGTIKPGTITVVEYLGDGLYKDLITEFIFSTQKTINEVINDSMYDKNNEHEKEKRINHPLAIKRFGDTMIGYEFCPELLELTEERKVQIVEKTVPMKKILTTQLSFLEGKAKTVVESRYDVIEKRIIRKQKEAEMIEEFDKLFITESNNNNNKTKKKKRG